MGRASTHARLDPVTNLNSDVKVGAAVSALVALALLAGFPQPSAAGPVRALGPVKRFAICRSRERRDCVVDGDTVWIDGAKIRIADIDAPETHPSRCPREARLGRNATLRLVELLNAGPFEMRTAGRATDRYGRKLRVISRGGRSLGEALVAEGLARRWDGRCRPWC